MNKKELVEFLIENFGNEYGLVDLRRLDFGDRIVLLSGMKAKIIHQNYHTADEISQARHTADEIHQDYHTADEIYQSRHKAEAIYQDYHTAKEIYQDND